MGDEPTYYHDPGGRKQKARARRIDELLAAASGAERDVGRGYFELVYDNEEAPMTTDAAQLRAAGFELPDSASLDDAALAAKLDELLLELDRMRVDVLNRDEVSKRELYELLVGRLLHEERPDVPMSRNGAWVIDISTLCFSGEEEGF